MWLYCAYYVVSVCRKHLQNKCKSGVRLHGQDRKRCAYEMTSSDMYGYIRETTIFLSLNTKFRICDASDNIKLASERTL